MTTRNLSKSKKSKTLKSLEKIYPASAGFAVCL